MYQIFNNEVKPKMDDSGNFITINHRMFQYPLYKVFVRNSYKTLWKILKYTIKLNELQEKINHIRRFKSSDKSQIDLFNTEIKNINVKLKTYLPSKDDGIELVNCFLLRGNPGLGKSSFIIYFLYKLRKYEEKHNLNYATSIYKSTGKKDVKSKSGKVIYEYKNGRMNRIDTDNKCKIVVSDSYDYDEDINSKYLVLFVSSPDMNNYSNFKGYNEFRKRYLYLDVFSEEEIEKWKDNCLPSDIANHIKPGVYKRYGRVPRHIYFDAIYKVCFKKEYWDDIYTKGINTVVGDIGFIDFIKKYIVPCRNENKKFKSIPEIEVFDITLCHYIVKYSYTDHHSIDEYSMKLISEEVLAYILNSIHHVTRQNEVDVILYIFYNCINYNHPLYKLLFQELVWCKFVYFTNTVKNVLGINRMKRVFLEEKFAVLFDSPIYQTSETDVYILLLATLKNGEVIYLMNNCFIHVHYDSRLCDTHRVNDWKMIKECKSLLKEGLKWNDFYYICVYADNADPEKSDNTEMGSCSFKSPLFIDNNIKDLVFYRIKLNGENYYKEIML